MKKSAVVMLAAAAMLDLPMRFYTPSNFIFSNSLFNPLEIRKARMKNNRNKAQKRRKNG